MSLSETVEFYLDNLPLLFKAIRSLRAQNPNVGSEPARLPANDMTLPPRIANRDVKL
jgi:hypothetical protein